MSIPIRKERLPVLILISIYFFLLAKSDASPQEVDASKSKKSRFFQGIFMSALNVFPIPYQAYVVTTLLSYQLLSLDNLSVGTYVAGATSGTFIALYIYILFFVGFAGFSQENPVSIQIDTTYIRIGEQIQLKISVNETTNVVFPTLKLDSLRKVEIVEVLPTDTLKNRLEKKYLLTSFDSGNYVIPQQLVLVNNKKFLTDSLMVNVATIKVDTTKQKMFPIKAIQREPKTFDDYRHLFWWLIPIFVLLAIILYFVFRKKREKEVPKVSEATKSVVSNLLKRQPETSEENQGEGDDIEQGDKGKIEGNPYSSSYYNTVGLGGEGKGYGLNGRNLLSNGKVVQECNQEGTVVVRITVNNQGNVIAAEPGVKGSTNTHPCLMGPAKKTALLHKW